MGLFPWLAAARLQSSRGFLSMCLFSEGTSHIDLDPATLVALFLN